MKPIRPIELKSFTDYKNAYEKETTEWIESNPSYEIVKELLNKNYEILILRKEVKRKQNLLI